MEGAFIANEKNSFAPEVLREEERHRIQAPMLLIIGDHEILLEAESLISMVLMLLDPYGSAYNWGFHQWRPDLTNYLSGLL